MRYIKIDKTLPDIKQHTDGSAGIDLCLKDNVVIYPNTTETVGTGIAVEIPEGYMGLVVPRSSSADVGVSLANTVGIIDSDYRGEIKLKLQSNGPLIKLSKFDRVVQLILVPCLKVQTKEVESLTDTTRGAGGFGSTNDNKKKRASGSRERKIQNSRVSKGK